MSFTQIFTLGILSFTLFMFPLTSYAGTDKSVQEKNKAIVLSFYDLAFNQHKPTEAAERYIGDQYVQHNPFVPNGAKAFTDYFEDFFRKNPESHVVIAHALADDDLVVLHLNSKLNPSDKGDAIVDIFRLKDGKIIEHWDVVQSVPDTTENGHTMFDDNAK